MAVHIVVSIEYERGVIWGSKGGTSTLQRLELDQAVLGYREDSSMGAYEHMSCTEYELDVQTYY